MPKRPLSAYNFFFGQVRRMGAVEGEGGEGKALGFAGLARAVAASWKSLDEDSKKPFYDMADHEQIRYKAACDEWRKSRRRSLNSPAKFDYVLQPRSPTPDDSQQRRTAPTAHASRRNNPQPTNCYSPETTHGYPRVPGIIVSVATKVANDNDFLDNSPRHYGNYTPNGYDYFYDTNTDPYNYNTSTYNTQSQRNGHPDHYANFRKERTGPIHPTEQHVGYYSGPVISPSAYDTVRSGLGYSSNYNRNSYNNNDFGLAQHMWSSVPPAYRAKVLGRALFATHTDANSLWMLLSGNPEVTFPWATAATAPAASVPAPGIAAVTDAALALVTLGATQAASTTAAGHDPTSKQLSLFSRQE